MVSDAIRRHTAALKAHTRAQTALDNYKDRHPATYHNDARYRELSAAAAKTRAARDRAARDMRAPKRREAARRGAQTRAANRQATSTAPSASRRGRSRSNRPASSAKPDSYFYGGSRAAGISVW